MFVFDQRIDKKPVRDLFHFIIRKLLCPESSFCENFPFLTNSNQFISIVHLESFQHQVTSIKGMPTITTSNLSITSLMKPLKWIKRFAPISPLGFAFYFFFREFVSLVKAISLTQNHKNVTEMNRDLKVTRGNLQHFVP